MLTNKSRMTVFQANGCNMDAVGGGCQEINKCVVTCNSCYRGVGKIIAACEPPGAGIYCGYVVVSF